MSKEKNKIIFNFALNKSSCEPLYIQLANRLTELIEQGEIEANARLPAIRCAADFFSVNSSTIISCYKYLENRKIIYSKPGSGTFVSPIDTYSLPEPVRQSSIKKLNMSAKENAVNFAKSSVSPELFPVSEFKMLFNEILDKDKGNAFSLNDTQGYLPLRKALSKSLTEKNSIRTDADKILITSGAQQGIDIITKAMLSYGDIVFVEKPTYYGAVSAILSRGAKIVEIPLLSDGVDTIILEKLLNLYHPKFMYVMPNYQTPSCISYSMEKKRILLELAYKNNFYIIEEDNLGDFNYSPTPVKTLKSLDYKNKVIYIKSFSKILMPGLRLGFMVMPMRIMENIISAKYSTDISTSSFIQKAFTLFINNGGWDRHIDRMKEHFSKKYSHTSAEIKKRLSRYFQYTEPNGGLSFCLCIKNKKISSDNLYSVLAEKGVVVIPASVYSLSSIEDDFIRLSFANVSNSEITKGISVIEAVFKDL